MARALPGYAARLRRPDLAAKTGYSAGCSFKVISGTSSLPFVSGL
jgi:hypothetical protein